MTTGNHGAGCEQALRRLRSARQRRLRGAVGLTDRIARAQRLGQVDAAAGHRRSRSARYRHASPSTGEDVTHVPPQRRGIGFVFQHYAAFKHLTVRDNVGFGLQHPQAAEGRDQGEGRQPSRSRRPRRLPDPLSEPAVRRAAAAHGAGARPRGRPAGAAARRAVRRAGRKGPRGSAGLAAPAARRGARHHGAGDARPGRGARRRRPRSRCSTRGASSRSAHRRRFTTRPPTRS